MLFVVMSILVPTFVYAVNQSPHLTDVIEKPIEFQLAYERRNFEIMLNYCTKYPRIIQPALESLSDEQYRSLLNIIKNDTQSQCSNRTLTTVSIISAAVSIGTALCAATCFEEDCKKIYTSVSANTFGLSIITCIPATCKQIKSYYTKKRLLEKLESLRTGTNIQLQVITQG